MNRHNKISINNIPYVSKYLMVNNFRFILIFLSGIIFIPHQLVKSDEIFLSCTARFEINRGELIKPDWETIYLKINVDELKSYIDDKGIKKEGNTKIRGNTYIITHKNRNNKIESKYKINGTHGNYKVEYPQRNRALIGTCQKGRG